MFVTDSVTRLPADHQGHVAIAASHGGVYAAWVGAHEGLRAVILSDAGIGRDRAGISGLPYLDAIKMAAATVGHMSARIGDGADMLARGVITFANRAAESAGVFPGQPARAALEALDAKARMPTAKPPPETEARHPIPGIDRAWLLDSNSLVTPDDAGAIIVTGSHGGLLGGRPETAVKYDVFAALYNDAGGGIDDAGFSRLPALDARGIAGATVDAISARIGEARSTYDTGIISRVNNTAKALGAQAGMTARAWVDCMNKGRT